ncbi:LmeA family phospholipid-binding protein [Nocardia sp. CDC160]|uniref:LmeA family phospholipid-binding protein n=1 Tax=Nocardia sp. CDC160 TaxID=3112166 RepID=UPI002DBB3970|nr:DUF2993 domain-containing protein [Nocardia sp. CDC160]MEC3914834.1 DUF2993 domain-containing protein [Nocardia sp. CDC160]
MRTLLILIVVLVAAVVVGDRVAVVMAQNEIARRIASEYSLPHQPSVRIGGFPFLTQAVDGTYHDIDIRVGDWNDKDVSVRDLDVKLTDVSAPLDDILNGRITNLVAATATANGVVSYDTVQHYAPDGIESITYGPDGMEASGKFSVQGIKVPAKVVATVASTDDGIKVTPVSVRPAAGGPAIPLALVSESLAFTVPLKQLPLGAHLTTIKAASDGIHVTAVAKSVHFSDLPKP